MASTKTVPGVHPDGWSYAAAASGIVNSTAAVTVKASPGPGLRSYVTGIQIMAEALGAATELVVRSPAGVVLWPTKIGTGGLTNGLSVVFPSPIAGAVDTSVSVTTLTASIAGAVYFNAQGVESP